MKKFLLLMIVSCSMTLFGETIDINKSEGTDQSVIESLRPAPASPEVDANVTIEAIFSEALNPMTTRRSARLKRLDGTKSQKGFFGFGPFGSDKSVSGTTDYDPDRHAVTFIPDQALDVGFYEVSFRHLMTQKPGMMMRIDPIVYRFYVPEVINGFKLPPEPDPKENDATLLGIDFNHNGIRDDVERWIITHYAKDPKYPRTKTAIALQYAKASQYIIGHDPKHAYEKKTYEIFDRAMDCKGYFIDKLINNGVKISDAYMNNDIFNDLKAKMFNTEERSKAYWKFNGSLSGHMLGGGGGVMSSTRDKCDIDIHTLGEIQ